MHLTSPRSQGRPGSRTVAALALLFVLAGCGRDDVKSSAVRDLGSLDIAPSTTVQPAAPAESPTTTTTAAPEPVAEPAPRAATVTTKPAVTEVVAKPAKPVVAPSTTTSTTPVTEPPVPAVEPPLPPVPPTVVVSSHGGPVRDHVSLVDNLRGRGLTVVPLESIKQPFLRGSGTSLAISGPGIGATRLQSHEYETAEAAAADAATIGPDGNPRTVMVEWVAPPHLYLRGRVLVIYVGTDTAVTSLLTDLLGPQFAGR